MTEEEKRDADRKIFRFFDGTKTRRADPLAVMVKIEDICPQFADLLTVVARSADKPLIPGPVADDLKAGQNAATAKLLEVTCTAFGVKPLGDTDGLTSAEQMTLLTRFLIFMGGLAEEARPLPSSPRVASNSRLEDSHTEPSAESITSDGESDEDSRKLLHSE